DRLVHPDGGEKRVLLRAGGADHVRAARLRDLHGEMPDPAGCGEDQHAALRADSGRLDQRLPRGEAGERQRRGLDVAEALRDQGQLAGGRRDVLGVRCGLARKTRHAEDPVAWREARHAAAELLDDAGHVPADGERRLPEKAATCADLPVDGVHPRRGDAHEHLSGARLGTRDVDELEDVRPAEGELANRTHRPGWHRCCIQARVSADPGEDMAASTETASAFPSPYAIETPPGCEGWEEMYPYHALFHEARRDVDESRFWFWNSMHFPLPMPAFDMACVDSPYQALGVWQNRVFAVPPAMGIDYRVVNGYVYITGNPVTDPDKIAER